MLSGMSFFLRSVKREYLCTSKEAICFLGYIFNRFNGSGVAHSVFILALVIAGGLCLNKIRFGSVSLGVTWILFVGIMAGHFGFLLDGTTAHFVKEFGLILFIYSIGLEVGPGFFSSFRKGGITLNMLAVGSVDASNVRDYLAAGAVGAGVASCLFKKEWIKAGEWDRITEASKAFVSLL